MFSNRFDKVIDTRAIDSIESSIRNVHRFERVIASMRKRHRFERFIDANSYRYEIVIDPAVKLRAKESTSLLLMDLL